AQCRHRGRASSPDDVGGHARLGCAAATRGRTAGNGARYDLDTSVAEVWTVESGSRGLLASGGGDGMVWFWDPVSGEEAGDPVLAHDPDLFDYPDELAICAFRK